MIRKVDVDNVFGTAQKKVMNILKDISFNKVDIKKTVYILKIIFSLIIQNLNIL